MPTTYVKICRFGNLRHSRLGSLRYLRLVFLVIVFALISPLLSALAASEYESRIYTNAAKKTLPYRLLKPLNYNAVTNYPLVLFFHDIGERGTNNQSQIGNLEKLFLNKKNRTNLPCFVVAPQCPDKQQWVDLPWGTDSGKRPEKVSVPMTLSMEILGRLAQEFSVDVRRIYLLGFSMGGYGVWDCLTRYPDQFAAAVPVCGGGDESTVDAASAKVPVWAFHSEDDIVIKPGRTRKMIAAMRALGGKPKYFEYFGLGHNCWDKVQNESELLPWMFSQRRGLPDRFSLKTPMPVLPKVAVWPPTEDLFPGKGSLPKLDWFPRVWRDRRLEFWMNRDKDKEKVVFLGDSIIQGWASLAKDFHGIKVVNRGISGDTTRGVLYRLKEDVTDLKPTAVVLLIGTNDLGWGGDVDTVAANIRAILSAFKKHNPKMPVIVCNVMPRTKNFAGRIQRLNTLVDEFIKADPQFTRCDTWSIFADDQGVANKEDFPDQLHPNAIGYAKWTAVLGPLIAKVVKQ